MKTDSTYTNVYIFIVNLALKPSDALRWFLINASDVKTSMLTRNYSLIIAVISLTDDFFLAMLATGLQGW